MPALRRPTAESVRAATEAAERFLHSLRHEARIAQWDLQNESFRKRVQHLWQLDHATNDVLCVLAELQLLEWIQSFAKHFPFLLFTDDESLLEFLTIFMQQAVQYINHKTTTIGDLWLGGDVTIAIPNTVFDVPHVLLEALQQTVIGPAMTELFLDQQQRRYDTIFLYLLCHVTTELYNYQSNTYSSYSMPEWQQYFQEYVWRYTPFSFSSEMVKSMMAFYWFDVFLTPTDHGLPYDCDLEQIDKLVYDERRENRLETVAEVTQLDYYLVVSFCVDRLITLHFNDENAWIVARKWYNADISASLLFLEQLKEKRNTSAKPDPPQFGVQTVYPFLIDMRVSCHFASPLRWNSAVRLAFELTELECLPNDEKVDVWQFLFRQMLWNDHPVFFYNFYSELRSKFRMQTIDSLLAAPRSSLAFHTLFCNMIDFRDDLQVSGDIPQDVRSYIYRLVTQMLWRLLLQQNASVASIPAEYRKFLLLDEASVDDTTLERRIRQFVKDAIPLPPGWRVEALDDHWIELFRTLEIANELTDASPARPPDEVAPKVPPLVRLSETSSLDTPGIAEDVMLRELTATEKETPRTVNASEFHQTEAVAETKYVPPETREEDQHDPDEEIAADVSMEYIQEAKEGEAPDFLRNRLEPEKDVPMEEVDDDDVQEDEEVSSDEGRDAENELADVAMDVDSDEVDDEEENDDDQEEGGVQEVYDIDDSSDDSRNLDGDNPPAGIRYNNYGEPEDGDMLDDESTETEEEPSEDSSSQPPDDEPVELERDDEEEVDDEDDDDTEHPKSIASSYLGSELTDRMRDGNDPDDEDNEAGYDAEESQDAATEEENEDLFVGGQASMEEFTRAELAMHDTNSLVELAPMVPLVMHNEVSTLVDKGYEPDSQGQTDVEGVPQPLQIMEAGYDAEDSQGHTEDEEVFDEEDEQALPILDHFSSIHAAMAPPSNGSPRVPPHAPRHTLSTDDMIADDEAESSEIEGEGGVEPHATSMPPSFEGGSLLMQVATTIQNEHFLSQPETSSQESHPMTQRSFYDDPSPSLDRSDERAIIANESIVQTAMETTVESAVETIDEIVMESIVKTAYEAIMETAMETIVDTATDEIVETAPEAIVETAAEATAETNTDAIAEPAHDAIAETVTEMIVETAPESCVEMATEAIVETATDMVVETETFAIKMESVKYPLPEADEESESSDSVRSHPGDEISCLVSVASSPQSSVGMQSAAKSETISPSSNITGQRVLTTPREEQKSPPKVQALKKTPASSTNSTAKSKTPSVRIKPPMTLLSESKRKRVPPVRLEPATEVRRTRARSRALDKKNTTEEQSQRLSTRVTAKKPPETPTIAETPQLVTQSRNSEKKYPTNTFSHRATRSRTPPEETAAPANTAPLETRATHYRTKIPENPPLEETPASAVTVPRVTRAMRSRTTTLENPSPEEIPSSKKTAPRETGATRSRTTTVVKPPPEEIAASANTASREKRMTRFRTATPVKPPPEETPASADTVAPATRTTRSRTTQAKPPPEDTPASKKAAPRAMRETRFQKTPPVNPSREETPASTDKAPRATRMTRSRTTTPLKPPSEESPATTSKASRDSRVPRSRMTTPVKPPSEETNTVSRELRSRTVGKPPTIPADDSKTSQRMTRSKRGAG